MEVCLVVERERVWQSSHAEDVNILRLLSGSSLASGKLLTKVAI